MITTKAPNGGARPRDARRLGDARSLRSQEMLRTALLELTEEIPFERITVRDVTAKASLSYPTFFKHYESKDDLFQDIVRKEILDFLSQGFRNGVSSPDWRPGEGICAFVASRRALWRTLLTAGASEVMRSEFIRRGREIPSSGPELAHGYPIDVVSGVIAGGVFEIVSWWLAQPSDYPEGRVAEMLEALVIEPALGRPPGFFTERGSADADPTRRPAGQPIRRGPAPGSSPSDDDPAPRGVRADGGR